MKPLTVDNLDGRTLLALRAGPMTAGELSARNGSGPARWLIKADYIAQDDSVYRLTEAGRAACPYRNPLAAPGVVSPATFKPEIDMSRENIITRQQVLAVITEAGASGITRKALIEHFGCPEANMDMHLVNLNRQTPPVVFKPKVGTTCAIQFQPLGAATPAPVKPQHATRETVMAWLEKQPEGYGGIPHAIAQDIGCSEESTSTVLAGLYGAMKVERAKVGDDLAYFLDRSDAEIRGEQSAESSPQADLTAMDEPQIPAITPSPETPSKIALKSPLTVESVPAITAPASAYPAEKIILPGGELAIPSRKQIEEIAGCLISPPTVGEDIPGRFGTFHMVVEEEDFEAGIYSDGTLNLLIEDGLQDAQLTFSAAALKKLRVFLGLFQEAA